MKLVIVSDSVIQIIWTEVTVVVVLHQNEGASTVGAILIPGTPTGPDAASWMLACLSSTTNRPFNNNDKTALSYLY